ncbi:MAG TPA: hypothetical protein VNZ64_01540 [Candidatus Acidoferrum sp.]|nr:hypothetical protein [Candidatus Acidoferrum sp.]
MSQMKQLPFGLKKVEAEIPGRTGGRTTLAALLCLLAAASALLASENAPRRPFAQWADVPPPGQLVAGAFYEQSEAYYIWAGNTRHNITLKTPDGESYGIDIRQGYFTLDYGLTEKWAADINFGATTVGWRSFDPNGGIQKTTGLMDTAFGVRYQIFNEKQQPSPWLPTLTFRAGAILPGSYSRSIPFAPGNHSATIEPSLLLRKHFGWSGLGVWGDAWYRWNHTISTDQYMASIGLFQEIGHWELDAGYRHQQATSGEDIILVGSQVPYDGISYKSDVKEVSDAIEAGFSYRTVKRQVRYGFHARKTFDGRNTDSKLWLGAYIDIPFGGKKEN